jgi:hypothetical protein
MSEHTLRRRFDSIVTEYEKVTDCAERYFEEKGWIKSGCYIQCMEADPTHLECIMSDGNVLHIHYDLLEKLLQGDTNT